MLNRLLAAAALAILSAILAPSFIQAQPQPSYLAQPTPIATAVTATGAQTAVRGLNVPKTYQVAGATSAGTGSAVVVIEGANASTGPWDTLGTVTLTLGTTATSGSFTSVDRYVYIRANAGTLTGTGANYTATMGY